MFHVFLSDYPPPLPSQPLPPPRLTHETQSNQRAFSSSVLDLTLETSYASSSSSAAFAPAPVAAVRRPGTRGSSRSSRQRPFSIRGASRSASPPGAAAAAAASTAAASPVEAGGAGAGADGDGLTGSPPSAGNGNVNGSGNRSSLRKSLKFLPDLLGGLSPASRLSRRHSQQTASQASLRCARASSIAIGDLLFHPPAECCCSYGVS